MVVLGRGAVSYERGIPVGLRFQVIGYSFMNLDLGFKVE